MDWADFLLYDLFFSAHQFLKDNNIPIADGIFIMFTIETFVGTEKYAYG